MSLCCLLQLHGNMIYWSVVELQFLLCVPFIVFLKSFTFESKSTYQIGCRGLLSVEHVMGFWGPVEKVGCIPIARKSPMEPLCAIHKGTQRQAVIQK